MKSFTSLPPSLLPIFWETIFINNFLVVLFSGCVSQFWSIKGIIFFFFWFFFKYNKISFGEVTQPILWEVQIYPLGKMHSILWEKSTILWEVVYYPRGKGHGYPLVSGTLSSGKWHIILWEKKLIPSGNWTRGTGIQPDTGPLSFSESLIINYQENGKSKQ